MHFPVILQFKPSRRLRAALVFLHLLALLAVLLLVLGILANTIATIVLCLSLLRFLDVVETPLLVLRDDGSLLWQCKEGNQSPGRVLSGTAFGWLVVLRIELEATAGKKCVRVLVALADSLSPPDFRRLQVWSRWIVSVRSAEESAEAS